MRETIKKIEDHAAGRLALPPGRTAVDEIGRFKTYLKVEAHRLRMLHRAGGEGLPLCQARAAAIDALIRALWAAALGAGGGEQPAAALVAVGGYGRGELNPCSDIDLLFLHHRQVSGGRPRPGFGHVIDGVLYPLWDLGLKVGHSVRTVSECVAAANADMQSKTAMIESRWLVGDRKLYDTFAAAVQRRCVAGRAREYCQLRLEDQAVRRAKFGNSASMQEPNLKNGCGGLRDYQNLLWMAHFKEGAGTLAELQKGEWITRAERKLLEKAHDFLLRARTAMHYETGKALDVLGKNIQPAVAQQLGYRERSPSKRIEAFMRDLYRHLRNVFLITRTVEQRLALLPAETVPPGLRAFVPARRKVVSEVVDGFRFVGGEIQAASRRVFQEDNRRLMRVFLYGQQRGFRLHADLAQMIRNQLDLVDGAFRRDARVRETFLTVLGQRGNVATTLRAMHEVDFLGRYLPEFGRMTCLVQHEFFHQYTVDEHTLVCLQQLDRVWEAKEPPHAAYAELLNKIERPWLLYLALLLHDLGKGLGHDHSVAGAEISRRVSSRLGLDAAAAQALAVLVENHLLLVAVSQRRDLDDPVIIRQVAEKVQTPEILCMLTLHTFADSMATSDKLWNGFKDSLLWSLHHRTVALFNGGAGLVRSDEMQREHLRREVRRIKPADVTDEELDAHLAALPSRYHLIHPAREVAQDLALAHQFMWNQVAGKGDGRAPVTGWQHEPDRGFSRVKICTWDRVGLFSRLAGSFSAAGLSILSAQVFTRSDNIALDTFCVIQARDGLLPGPAPQAEFEGILETVLTGGEVDFHRLIARQKITRPPYQAYSGELIGTRIRFDNTASESRTLIEVETEDRLGLLYAICEALAALSLDISAARIATERGGASDSFYVRERGGGQVAGADRQGEIEASLRQAILRLDDQHPAGARGA